VRRVPLDRGLAERVVEGWLRGALRTRERT